MLLISALPILVAAADVVSGLKENFPNQAERISDYRYTPESGEMVLKTDLNINDVFPIFDHMADHPSDYGIDKITLAWATDDLDAEGPRVDDFN